MEITSFLLKGTTLLAHTTSVLANTKQTPNSSTGKYKIVQKNTASKTKTFYTTRFLWWKTCYLSRMQTI